MKYKRLLKSSVSSKGQVTIPKEIRQRLGFVPGVEIHFEIVDGAAVLKKATRPGLGIRDYFGFLLGSPLAPEETDSLKLVARLRGRDE